MTSRFGVEMKAQTQIISAILVFLVALAAVALVLPWALTMVQKKKDMKNVDDVYNFFLKLDEVIRDVAKNGGEESLTLKVPGELTVYPDSSNHPYNNSITFSFLSKVSNIAVNVGEIPLNTPNQNSTATLGVDTPSVIFGKANLTDDSILVQYRLWYRTLVDVDGDKFKIVLNTSENSILNSTLGFVRVQRLGTRTVGDLTLTEINVIV